MGRSTVSIQGAHSGVETPVSSLVGFVSRGFIRSLHLRVGCNSGIIDDGLYNPGLGILVWHFPVKIRHSVGKGNEENFSQLHGCYCFALMMLIGDIEKDRVGLIL